MMIQLSWKNVVAISVMIILLILAMVFITVDNRKLYKTNPDYTELYRRMDSVADVNQHVVMTLKKDIAELEAAIQKQSEELVIINNNYKKKKDEIEALDADGQFDLLISNVARH